MLTLNHAVASCSDRGLPRRSAIVTLETIVWLPVLAILLAAVIEIGLILTGAMHVATASRLGAKLAAEDPRLTNTVMVPMPQAAVDEIAVAIDNYLENAGYGSSATEGVRLQYNTIGDGSSYLSVVNSGGTCPEQNSPPFPLLNNTPNDFDDDFPRAIRVVVCVNATTISPNLLSTFGFDTSSTTLELSTTYPYELLP